MTDEELDGQVRDIKLFHPNCGSKNLAGFLTSRNIKVPRERLRQSLQRADPIGISVRRCRAVYRIDVFILCLVLLLYGILTETISLLYGVSWCTDVLMVLPEFLISSV